MVHHAIALLTALTLLFASGTAVAGDHHCGGRSMPSTDCCCDHESESDEAEAQQDSKISGTCCQLRAPAPTAPPLVPVVIDVQTPEVLAAPTAIVAVPPQLPSAPIVATQGGSPTVRGPPAFLLNCRFLI